MAMDPNLLAFPRPSLSVSANVSPISTPDVLLGPSPAIARVWSQIRRVAPYFRMALITGEPGAGAEAVAQALHALSPLSAQPLSVVPATEADSFLASQISPVKKATTLFIPEMERLSPASQASLLRLIRYRPPNQVCVIAAANGDLRSRVGAGSFSAALAASLTALHISLPSLRQRTEDIPALASHFLAREAEALGQVNPVAGVEFYQALVEAQWPGNIEQLRSVMRKLLQQHPGQPPSTAHLMPLLEATQSHTLPSEEPVRLLKLEQVIQEHIRAVLLGCNGNKLRAAEVLGISRSTLYRMLEAQSGTKPLSIAS